MLWKCVFYVTKMRIMVAKGVGLHSRAGGNDKFMHVVCLGMRWGYVYMGRSKRQSYDLALTGNDVC